MELELHFFSKIYFFRGFQQDLELHFFQEQGSVIISEGRNKPSKIVGPSYSNKKSNSPSNTDNSIHSNDQQAALRGQPCLSPPAITTDEKVRSPSSFPAHVRLSICSPSSGPTPHPSPLSCQLLRQREYEQPYGRRRPPRVGLGPLRIPSCFVPRDCLCASAVIST